MLRFGYLLDLLSGWLRRLPSVLPPVPFGRLAPVGSRIAPEPHPPVVRATRLAPFRW